MPAVKLTREDWSIIAVMKINGFSQKHIASHLAVAPITIREIEKKADFKEFERGVLIGHAQEKGRQAARKEATE